MTSMQMQQKGNKNQQNIKFGDDPYSGRQTGVTWAHTVHSKGELKTGIHQISLKFTSKPHQENRYLRFCYNQKHLNRGFINLIYCKFNFYFKFLVTVSLYVDPIIFVHHIKALPFEATHVHSFRFDIKDWVTCFTVILKPFKINHWPWNFNTCI